MEIFFSSKAGVIKQHGSIIVASLSPWFGDNSSDGISIGSSRSLLIFHGLIEFAFLSSQLDVGVHLGSSLGMEESLSESGAPLLVEARVSKRRMRSKQSFLSITSEKARSGVVKVSLISMEASALESLMCFLKFVFLIETSSCDFSINSTQL